MKITIELSDAQVKGIKDYLREVDGTEKPTKEDVKNLCEGELNAVLQSGAIAEYIIKYENQ